MAEAQQSSTFPAPPPFYRYFTNRNVRQAEQHSETRSPELRYLVPPPPPKDGKWRAFGHDNELVPPEPKLEDYDVQRLVPDRPSIKLAPQHYLIALARSMLTKFLELCGVLAQNPSLYEQELKHLRELAINLQHLINEYRPHEARESLITMMEEHMAQLRQEIGTIEELKNKLESAISLQDADVGTQETASAPAARQLRNASDRPSDRQEQQHEAWNALAQLHGESIEDTTIKQDDD